ncbi:transcriptional regulator [bacterium]|jgi:predicted transcriptional regulator|nr:transcriptional regulator [bacterium]
MRKVILEVASRDAVSRRFRNALAGKAQGARLSFKSPALLIKVLSGRRWDLLQVMAGAGSMTIREAARRMERDVKGVHTDVHTLLAAGLLRKTDDDRIVFPYDAIHVDFTLRAA